MDHYGGPDGPFYRFCEKSEGGESGEGAAGTGIGDHMGEAISLKGLSGSRTDAMFRG